MFVFKDFKKAVKSFHEQDVQTDNIVFRLHYRLTFWFLVACCFLVSSKQFIKDHINCISDKHVQPVIETFCFFSSTFTVAELQNSSFVRSGVAAHPGVGPYSGKGGVIYHTYYQWVPFVLFIQALTFYGPRKLWKHSDNGRLVAIVHAMRTGKLVGDENRTINNIKIESDKSRSEKVERFCKMYLSMARFRVSRDWALMLIVCEFLNFVNLLLQMWLTNQFLRGKFESLGIDWWHDDHDALDRVFPKVTKCTFHKYGPSGSIQTHDTICVMSLNIVNEKIYVVLWFWFIGLFIISALGLVWRLLTFLLHNKSYAFNKMVWGEISPGPAIYPQDIEILTRQLFFSDWLFLYYIGKNIDGKMFRTAVSQMARELSKNKPNRLIKLENSHDEDPKESDC